MKRIIKKALVASAALTVLFAFTSAQAAEVELEGVIVSLDGSNVLVRSSAGNVTLTVNEATKVERTKGLFGIRSDDMTADTLIPGLSINVVADSNGNQTIAKSIKFDADDLQRATEIQAALAVPQQEAKALREKVKAQEQVIAAQEQQIAANKQQIATEQAEVDKRFGEMADYDMKSEISIPFDINSAKLSEQAKQDLQALATKAKTYKGYLIQVAGYASATGSAELNQDLSNRRAEAVSTYLRQSCDVGMSRVLAPVAMSTAKPVASNETAQGQAENRRVVVRIAVNRAIGE
jgi:outer membrane protein OmpA-like peptidoglycan-associated protein